VAINLRNDLINVSRTHFLSHIEKHRINVENLLNNSVGIGEHGDIMDTIEKELEEMSKYHDLLEVLDKYFPQDFNGDDTRKLLNERT